MTVVMDDSLHTSMATGLANLLTPALHALHALYALRSARRCESRGCYAGVTTCR